MVLIYSEHSTFTPLYTSIFYAYIDLVSNYNKMSSAVLATQTGESSNLYQIVDNYYSEQYGSMYLYTVNPMKTQREHYEKLGVVHS